jgi:hypothetical protein
MGQTRPFDRGNSGGGSGPGIEIRAGMLPWSRAVSRLELHHRPCRRRAKRSSICRFHIKYLDIVASPV